MCIRDRLCGAQESPLDSGSIPIKVAVLYVAEVLVLRYILDDKPGGGQGENAAIKGGVPGTDLSLIHI